MHPAIGIFRAPETRRILLRLIAVLLALRIGAHLPLFPELPGLRPALRASPYLTLLDVFSGGAIACGSAFSLGLFPYFLARPLLALLPRRAAEPRARRRSSIRLTLLLAAVLAFLYPFGLSRVADVPLSPRGGLVFLTLTAGAALTLWLSTLLAPDENDLDRGAALLVTAQVLAVLPETLASSGRGFWPGTLLVLVVSALYFLFALAHRHIPVRGRGERDLPISLNQSGLAPLLWLLAAFGVLRTFAHVLAGAEAGWARQLAAFELRWTDLGSWEGWIALALLGFPVKLAVARTRLDGDEMARELQRDESVVPGFRPGRQTAAYIDRTFARIGWAEPLVTPWLLAGVALLDLRLNPGGPRAPVLLVAALTTVLPVWDLILRLQSRWTLQRYDHLVPKAPLQSRRS